MNVLADVGFLCDKPTVQQETPCLYLHTLTHIRLENLDFQKIGSVPWKGG
jgi:hypothetical protein